MALLVLSDFRLKIKETCDKSHLKYLLSLLKTETEFWI